MIVRPLVVAALLAIGATMFSTSAGASTSLLPGETVTSQGVPSYVFGTNDGPDYGTPNVDTLPSVQATIKSGGLTFMRIWTYYGDTKAYDLSKVAAAQNSGATCMVMLGETEKLLFMEKVIGWTDSYCKIYEFGNEPDYAPSHNANFAAYVKQWNHDIPIFRSLYPGLVFGGPAVAYPTVADGSIAPFSSDIAYFLAKSKAHNAVPDFVSYHDYPCNGASNWDSTTQQAQVDCLNHITFSSNGYGGAAGTCTLTAGSCTQGNGAFAQDQQEVVGWEQQYLGTTVPTGISEYNFDPGSGTLGAWANDSTFMYDWQVAASDSFVFSGLSFACEYTTLNWAGYGALDMFDDNTFAPKPQFNAMVDEVAKYR